jgi:hypothetical protein
MSKRLGSSSFAHGCDEQEAADIHRCHREQHFFHLEKNHNTAQNYFESTTVVVRSLIIDFIKPFSKHYSDVKNR